MLLVSESGSGDDVFIMHLRDLWHKQWNVDVHNQSRIVTLYVELEQMEHAKQSQQSPTQVVLHSSYHNMLSTFYCWNLMVSALSHVEKQQQML